MLGDNINCYLCTKEGHISKDCPDSTNKETNFPISTTTLLMPSQLKTPLDQSMNNKPRGAMKSLSQILNNNLPSKNILGYNNAKGPLSELISQITQKMVPEEEGTDSSLMEVEDSSDDMNTTLPTVQKSIKRKRKMSSSEKTDTKTVEEMIGPIKEVLDTSTNKYVINYSQFKSFMENAKGNPNVTELALSYTKDIPALSNMIKQMYPYFTDRKVKNRYDLNIFYGGKERKTTESLLQQACNAL
ncbi:hypothetical protein ANTPLA_LOCUS2878 [Anthophora plagiata]